jgi:hypothetical protein
VHQDTTVLLVPCMTNSTHAPGVHTQILIASLAHLSAMLVLQGTFVLQGHTRLTSALLAIIAPKVLTTINTILVLVAKYLRKEDQIVGHANKASSANNTKPLRELCAQLVHMVRHRD